MLLKTKDEDFQASRARGRMGRLDPYGVEGVARGRAPWAMGAECPRLATCTQFSPFQRERMRSIQFRKWTLRFSEMSSTKGTS